MKGYRVIGAALVCAAIAVALALVAGAFGGGPAQAAPPGQAAKVGTLTIDGLAGASSLELESFSWGLKNPATGGSAGGGAGAGKATFNDAVVQRRADAVSPSLIEAAATGEHFPSATIQVTTGKGGAMRYTLHTVFVTGVQHTNTGDGTVETLTLTYGAVNVSAVS